jgi:ACR3 family arsenite transporter
MTRPVISDERESAALGAPAGTVPPAVVRQLSTLDRWLPLWIGVAMGVGLGLGALIPGLESALSSVAIGGTSLPIAIGLLLMMYPVLARVRYEELGRLRAERGLFVSSLVLNWVIGPLLMFALAWLLLPHDPEYRTGLIVVGLARCIAMVLIWSELACADREATAVLVAINSIFQIVAYSLLGWFYLTVLPGWLGLDTEGFSVGIWEVARTVLIFLGIPLAAGSLTRVIGLRRKGRDWYEGTFLPRIGPITLYGLLFTIVLLFALQGHQITGHPLDVVRIALPLLVYFALMFGIAFAWGRASGYGYPRTATLALTAASNNFELAIAVAIGVFGATSGEALAGVVGPLIEVPVLVGLVYLSLWLRGRWFASAPDPGTVEAA